MERVTNTKTARHTELIGLMALIGANPTEMIERDEQRGAREMAKADQLPKKGFDECRQMFEATGGKVIGDSSDPIFLDVVMPPGWQKVMTGHSMWTDIHDENGLKRGSIFYKAAFYDRSAHMNWNCRFHARYDTVDYDSDRDDREYYPTIVDSNGKVHWRGKIVKTETLEELRAGTRDATKECAQAAQKLLGELYPDHNRIEAYWWLPVPVFPASESEDPKGDKYSLHFTTYYITEKEDNPIRDALREFGLDRFGSIDDNYYMFCPSHGMITKRFYQEYKSDGNGHKDMVFLDEVSAIKYFEKYLQRFETRYAKITYTIQCGDRTVKEGELIFAKLSSKPRIEKCKRTSKIPR